MYVLNITPTQSCEVKCFLWGIDPGGKIGENVKTLAMKETIKLRIIL